MNRQFRNLGISAANPAQYAAAFGASLVHASALPALSRGIRPANGARLAAEATPIPVRLVGDVAALSLINRARHLAAPAALAAAPAISYRAAAPAISYRAVAPAISYRAAAPAISYRAAAPAISYRAAASAIAAPSFLSGSALASASGLAYDSNLLGASALASASASGSALASGSYTF